MKDDGCPGMAAAVASASSFGNYFIHHTEATSFLRERLSSFFLTSFPTSFPAGVTDSVRFKQQMDNLGDLQLTGTCCTQTSHTCIGLFFFIKIRNWNFEILFIY